MNTAESRQFLQCHQQRLTALVQALQPTRYSVQSQEKSPEHSLTKEIGGGSGKNGIHVTLGLRLWVEDFIFLDQFWVYIKQDRDFPSTFHLLACIVA